jgi:hypothetical protein
MLGCWLAFTNAVSFELPKLLPDLISAAYATAKLETRSIVCFIMSGCMVMNVCGVEYSGIYIGCLPSHCFCDRHAYHHQDHLPSQLNLSNLRHALILSTLQHHVRSVLYLSCKLCCGSESFDRQQRHAVLQFQLLFLSSLTNTGEDHYIYGNKKRGRRMRRKKYDIGIVVTEVQSQATNGRGLFQPTTTRGHSHGNETLFFHKVCVTFIHTLREESQSPSGASFHCFSASSNL